MSSAALALIERVENAGRREDARILLDLMTQVTGEKAQVHGTVIGFGTYHFAPRKANMVVYIMPGFDDYQDLMADLGRYRTGSSCLYLGRLKSVNLEVLKTLITQSVAHMRRKYQA
jgi:hypothetical protein